MHISSLIYALADGEFHSGSELGSRLGVSRTAIWKALGRLTEYGLSHESHKGKGYRLAAPLDLIDLERVSGLLEEAVRSELHLESLLSCASTNSEVHRLVSNEKRFSALLSEQQTQGKGRRGRAWCSPFAENIYLSLCFKWEYGTAALQGLSIVVGLTVAELLKELGLEDVGVKWPNDVWVGGEKVAGILIELDGEVTSQWRVTIGLGLNVHMTQAAGSEIDQSWTSVSHHTSVERSELAAHLLNRLYAALIEFEKFGFVHFADRYSELDALAGKEVVLRGPDVTGVVIGLDEQGALRMRVDGQEQVFHAGEVSVRPL